MRILPFASILVFNFSLYACADSESLTPSPSSEIIKNITVDINAQHQTIDGFSASDCWATNYIGRGWSESQKSRMAELLFSTEVTTGQPKGIGLSMWRFNLGGGTSIQGDASGISDKSRRADCFMMPDGSLDWTRHEGQQYFLDKAIEFGCESFTLFSNTPPVNMTKNGKGYSSTGGYANLKPDAYGDFAQYIGDVLTYFKDSKGVEFDYISPVNEPQYNWGDGNQEGSGWQNAEVAKLTKEINKVLDKNNSTTEILLSEAASYEYLYGVKDDANRSDAINAFFNPNSDHYVGELSHVAPIIGGHAYWVDGTGNDLYTTRTKVNTAAKAAGLKFHQTEWSMLGDHYNDIYPGHDNSSYTDIALYMSRVIHHDMVYANASSWSYWTAIDVERWNHKNRFLLISVNPADGVNGDIELSGTHKATKTLWALGNYSLFVRPEYRRVDLDIENPSAYFFGSAYLSPDSRELVVVYTNMSKKDITPKMKVGKDIKSVKKYITNATNNLKLDDSNQSVEAESIVTFVYQL